MKFCVVNLGCKVNRVESDGFERQLLMANAQKSSENDADLIVINTCTVTAEAEKKTRKAIHHALRINPKASVVVTGCASEIDKDAFQQMDARVEVVPKADMEAYLAAIAADKITSSGHDSQKPFLQTSGAVSTQICGMHEEDRSHKVSRSYSSKVTDENVLLGNERARVGVKIQDGCNNACSFCIVHKARGTSVSRNADEVIEHCCALARAGIREIVLTGINLGSYADGGTDLTDLLSRLLDQTANIYESDEYPVRFRLSSIEPMNVDDRLIEILSDSNGRICRHLHLPLQSGSSRVLHEMARPYSAEDYYDLVLRLRENIPNLALTTDVIAGFPGETDEDFKQTYELAQACGFSKMHVFPYSRRNGTPAAQRKDQIPHDVLQDRAAQLRDLSQVLRSSDLAQRKGTCELAIVIQDGKAMSESYYEVDLPEGETVGSLLRYTF